MSCVDSSDLKTLIHNLHASEWIKIQSDSNQKLKKAIESDIAQEPWRISFSRETQPRSASEDTFSIQRQINSVWLENSLKREAKIEGEIQNLAFTRHIRQMEFKLHRNFYKALKFQIELELRREFLFSLNRFIEKQEFRIGQGVGNESELELLRQQAVLESQRIRALNAVLLDIASELVSLSEFDKEMIPLKGKMLPAWSQEIQQAELRLIDRNLILMEAQLEMNQLQQKNQILQNKFFKHYNIELGTKRFSEAHSADSGIIFGISTPIPMNSTNRSKRKRFEMMHQYKEAQYNHKKSYLVSRLGSLGQLIKQTIRQGVEQRQILVGPAEDLFKNKEDAFYNGRGSLNDLLKSRQHLLDSYLELNETEFRARQNWLEFKALAIGVE